MEAEGKKNLLEKTLERSLAAAAAGVLAAILLGNIFLAPALGGVCAALPFLIASSAVKRHEHLLREESEAAASIITTAYLRLGNFPAAVAESLPYLKSPARELFLSFEEEASLMNEGTARALFHLEQKVSDPVFREWCEQAMLCLEDRSLAPTLPPLVAKMNEERLIKRETLIEVRARRSEFLALALMTVGSIPLMRLLNRDWYRTLVGTLPGKLTLGICALVLLWTSLKVISLSEA